MDWPAHLLIVRGGGVTLCNFLFNKKELHINVLGARSAPSVHREIYSCRNGVYCMTSSLEME